MIEGVLSRMYLATCSMTARIDPEVDDQLTKWINVTRDSFFLNVSFVCAQNGSRKKSLTLIIQFQINLDSTLPWSLQHSMTPNDDMKHAVCNAHFLF